MKQNLLFSMLLCLSFQLHAQKNVYIPKDLVNNDFNNPDSKYAYARMASTNNLVIFWEKPFGANPAEVPQLEGKPMTWDVNNLLQRTESFYKFFSDTLKFVKSGSKAEQYKMMIMVNYSLEGTAYGGDYDQQIGALWVTPNRIQDKKLNCIAHELGHSFQSQITSDGQGEAWGGSGFFEMTSQWMLWQVNPLWMTDEEYHWKAFMDQTHLAFLSLGNIYHSPYVLEYWGEKRGLPFIAEMFRQGKKGEDPVMTYQRMTGLSQLQFNDEMFDVYRHLITYDMDRVREVAKPYANRFTCKLDTLDNGWMQINKGRCPQNYGFNAIRLNIPLPGKKVTVSFKGIAGTEGFNKVNIDKAGWRYGFVGVKKDGTTIYGAAGNQIKEKISFKAPKGESLAYLWLVVMGAPTEHWMNPDAIPNMSENEHEKTAPQPDAEWPYQIKIQ